MLKLKAWVTEYISLQVLKKMWYFPSQTEVMFFSWVISKKIFVSSSLCIYPIFFFPATRQVFCMNNRKTADTLLAQRPLRAETADASSLQQDFSLCALSVCNKSASALWANMQIFFFFKPATIIILKRASKYENCAGISSPAFPHWLCSRSPRWSSGLEKPLTHIHTHRAQRRDPL